MIWRQRKLVAATMGVALVGAVGFLLVTRPIYSSTARLDVEQNVARVMGSDIDDEQRSDNYLNTQCEVITSTPIFALALEQDGVADLKALRGVADPIYYLQKNTTAEVGKKSDLIEVTVGADDPRDAASLVNAVVKAYVSYEDKNQHRTSGEVLDILDKERDRGEAKLDDLRKQMAAMQEKYGDVIVTTAKDGNPILQQQAGLSDELSKARIEAVNAKAAYEDALRMISGDPAKLREIEAPDDTSDLAAANDQQLEMIRSEMFRLGEQLADMQRSYMPSHPLVRQAKSRLDELTVSYIRAERQRWLASQGRQSELQSQFEELHREAIDQATRAAAYEQLDAEYAQTQKAVAEFEDRISQVSANQDAGALNINVLENGAIEDKPSYPQKKKTLAEALLAGLVIGSGLAIGKEKMTAAQGPSKLSSQLGLPVLGVIPDMQGVATASLRALQTHLEPGGSVADAARGIVRAMANAGLDEESGRTLLVASHNPLDGRSTFAVNIAAAMAQSGLNVLLVDANNKSPRLHHLFGADNGFGFFDVLAGHISDNPAVVKTTIDGVDLLPSGPQPTNALELLNSEALVDLLGELTDRYDRVIVDSPALARGVEARILAASCATAVLITSARPTQGRQMDQAKRMLQSVGAHILGAVVNEAASNLPARTDRGSRTALPGNRSALRPVEFAARAEI